MISDLDIYRTAKLLIDQHGDVACAPRYQIVFTEGLHEEGGGRTSWTMPSHI